MLPGVVSPAHPVQRLVAPASANALVRIAAIAAFVILLGAVHVRRPATLCLLRGTTGIPCPFCGGTTAAVELGHADLSAALAASPLGVATVIALPFLSRIRAQLRRLPTRLTLSLLAVVLVASEFWQLARFDLLPF
jgi:hypothetical protein